MSPTYLIGYVLGAVMLVMGVSVLGGFFVGNGGVMTDTTVRTVFGIVLILFGIYRIVITTQARKRGARQQGG